ncbi:MAG: fasciclin domain-containing protein [Bacteroidota bacterium]
MKLRSNILTIIATIAMVSAFTFTSCESNDEDEKQQNIVQLASSNPDFSILVSALQKAELVTTLQGTGPFTVFAPTNAAFNQLFAALGVTGINDLTKEQLTPILLYHVLGAKVKSTDLKSGYVSTLTPGVGSTYASLRVDAAKFKLNGDVSITSADLEATNGVVHVIDKVLLPPTVVDIALANENFSILVSALVKAELVETLKGTGPFTVFAPTNDAFNALFAELGVTGIDQLSKETLTPILLYHVVSGNVMSNQLSTGYVATLNGSSISVNVGTSVTIDQNASVVLADVQGTNGVVHVINKVLVPSSNN